jgi:hypothetical protein
LDDFTSITNFHFSNCFCDLMKHRTQLSLPFSALHPAQHLFLVLLVRPVQPFRVRLQLLLFRLDRVRRQPGRRTLLLQTRVRRPPLCRRRRRRTRDRRRGAGADLRLCKRKVYFNLGVVYSVYRVLGSAFPMPVLNQTTWPVQPEKSRADTKKALKNTHTRLGSKT